MQKVLGALVLASISSHAMAEVSDKIASIPDMWLQGLVFGGVALFASYKKWWLVFFGLALSVFFITATLDMQSDEHLQQAIIKEQGHGYFWHGYLAYALVALGAISGLWRHVKSGAGKGT